MAKPDKITKKITIIGAAVAVAFIILSAVLKLDAKVMLSGVVVIYKRKK